jgi:hypothetical protein
MVMVRFATLGALTLGTLSALATGAAAQPDTEAPGASTGPGRRGKPPAAKPAKPDASRPGKPAAVTPDVDGDDALSDDALDAKADAKALVQSGVKLLRQKDYRGALAVFRDAYQRFPSVKLLLNIGTTLKLLERDADAANAYQRYLDDPGADPARVAEVKDVLAQLDRQVGVVEVQIEVNIEVQRRAAAPPRAEVELSDGEWTSLRAGPLRVEPGPFALQVRAPGYQRGSVSGLAVAGQTLQRTVQLTPLPEAGPPTAGPSEAPAAGLALRRDASAGPRSRLGLMLRGHFHISPAGAAALLGGTVDLNSRGEAHLGVLLGRFRGGYAGGSYALLPGRIRPLVSGGLLLVADDGARVAVRGAAGVDVTINRNVSLFVELGGEHLFNPAMTVFANAFVPSAGVLGRL